MEKKYRGKSNLSILQHYLDGTRPFITTGYTPTPVTRTVGSMWVDNKGITWKQENGYRKRVNKNADTIRESISQRCNECKMEIKWGSKQDRQFFNRTGLCGNCLIEYETKLRICGVYSDYEIYKLLSYELGSLIEMKEKLNEVISFFSNTSGDIEMICNSEGFVERWKNTNQQDILIGAKKDLKLLDKKIKTVKVNKTKAMRLYATGAKRYKLRVYA